MTNLSEILKEFNEVRKQNTFQRMPFVERFLTQAITAALEQGYKDGREEACTDLLDMIKAGLHPNKESEKTVHAIKVFIEQIRKT